MTPDALQRLSTLLDEALNLPPADRGAWLAGLSGDSLVLVPTLRDLLAKHASKETADLIDRLPAFTLPSSTPADATLAATGEPIGPYRLISELGRGGMGTVWLAERADGTLRRKVALKLPHVGWSSSLVERFAREREILAHLEHPNIARLYDAGLDQRGRPYMAIEYVEGQSIDTFCSERNLGVEARLRLLLQVTDAVAFAHSRLVVHRDLKPSNILVTHHGQVRLLDFGIAKLMEGDRAAETAITRAAGRALTLDYASPEQIRGEPIGTASDVYSLAVVAYELLAGTRPYRLKRQSAAALEEAIASLDIPLASQCTDDPALKKQLHGDLDAILNKALKKTVAERYATADALAQDWRLFLDGQRVHARPDTLGYRLARWGRRYRVPLAAAGLTAVAFGVGVGVGATALVILVLLLGLGAALWQTRQAREQARIARVQASTAEAVQSFLEGLFRANSGDQADPVQARQRTAKDLLDEGAARIERDLDSVPAAKMRVLKTLVSMYEDISDFDAVTRMSQQCVDLALRLYGDPSPELALALAEHADRLCDQARDAEALRYLARAEAILNLRLDKTDDARIALDLAQANYWRLRGDPRGLEHARAAAAMLRLRAPSQRLLNSLLMLGSLERMAGRLEPAASALREAIAAAPTLPGGAASALPTIHLELAITESARGKAAAAEAEMRRALALAEANAGPTGYAAVVIESRLAQFLYEHDRNRDSLEVLRSSHARLDQWGESPTKDSATVPILLIEAIARRQYGHVEESLRLVERGFALGARAAEDPSIAIWLMIVRAQALLDQGHAEALPAFEAAAAFLQVHGLESAALHETLQRLHVDVLLAQGRAHEAQTVLLRWAEPAASQVLPRFLTARRTARSEIQFALAKFDDCETEARDALAGIDASPGEPAAARHRLRLLGLIGAALVSQGKFDEAIDPLRAALKLAETIGDPQRSPELMRVVATLAAALRGNGNALEAQALCTRAAAIRASHGVLGAHWTDGAAGPWAT